MEISLFFPAFNEEKNIEDSVNQALAVLPEIASEFEVIIVNDGSTDATLKIAHKLTKQSSHVRVVTQKNKGYGGALKLGFASAKYNWVFFTDADLQFNLKDLKRFTKLTNNYDLIIGYRLVRAEGWKRHIFAVALRLWNWSLLSFPWSIRDVDCAFKLINRSVIERASPLECDGAMISAELILKAKRAGFNIGQLPVKHYPRRIGNPSGNSLGVIVKAIKETTKLQYFLLFGRRQAAYETSWR